MIAKGNGYNKRGVQQFGSMVLAIVLPQAALKLAKAARQSRQAVQASEVEKSRNEKRMSDGEVVCSSCRNAVQCSIYYKNKPHKGDYLCKDAAACGLRLGQTKANLQGGGHVTTDSCANCAATMSFQVIC